MKGSADPVKNSRYSELWKGIYPYMYVMTHELDLFIYMYVVHLWFC